MTTTSEQIDLWRQSASELPRLEFKEATLQFDNRKLYEYCGAIANEGGGRLLLGIAERSPRPVVGTQLSEVRSLPPVLGMSLFKRNRNTTPARFRKLLIKITLFI